MSTFPSQEQEERRTDRMWTILLMHASHFVEAGRYRCMFVIQRRVNPWVGPARLAFQIRRLQVSMGYFVFWLDASDEDGTRPREDESLPTVPLLHPICLADRFRSRDTMYLRIIVEVVDAMVDSRLKKRKSKWQWVQGLHKWTKENYVTKKVCFGDITTIARSYRAELRKSVCSDDFVPVM